MPQDTSAFDSVLKDVYGDGIIEAISTKTKVLDMFERKPASDYGGREVTYPVHVGRNEGSGWYSELGNLPSAGRQKHVPWHIPMKYMAGRVAFSTQVMKLSQGGQNAFAPAMRLEMDGLIKDMSANRGRSALSDGRGVLALQNGSAAAALPVDSPGGVAGATNGGRFFNEGMIVGFVNPSTGALRASSVRTVQSINSTGTTVTLDSSPTNGTDNDYIVRIAQTGSTDVADSSYAKEFTGLLAHVDDGTYMSTYHGINRTTYPLLQSTVITNVGALSQDVLQRAIDIVDQTSEGEISDLIMHHSVRRAYIAVDLDHRRYMGQDASKMDIGTVAAKKGSLTFGGIPIMEERYCPYGMIFGLDRSGLRRFVEVNGEWMQEDGSILQRIGTGTTMQDAYEAVYRIWDEPHNDYPNRCFRLEGVSATVAVTHVY